MAMSRKVYLSDGAKKSNQATLATLHTPADKYAINKPPVSRVRPGADLFDGRAQEL